MINTNIIHIYNKLIVIKTMCAKVSNKIHGYLYPHFVMYFFIKLFVRLLKRILRVTLYALLWTILFIVIIILIWEAKTHNINSAVRRNSHNPLIVWWTSGFPGTSETRTCSNNIKCDVFSKNESQPHNVGAYLFYGSNINFYNLPLPRQPSDIVWGLYHEESPRNVEELMHEETLKLFNFSSTLSRYSNVPFPLQYLDSLQDITSRKYFVETPIKNSFLTEISPIMYMQTDCETSTERDAYVKELMKHIEVDSYGACLKNKAMPSKFTNDYLNNLNDDEFLDFVARYKFVIAIENGVCDDYITEKFWRPIKIGSVPIYFGSPLIRDWFPNNKSAILLEDFPTPEILVEHIKELLENDVLYNEYLEHKINQVITNENLVKELAERPYQTDTLKIVEEFECFICTKLHKRNEGEIEVSIVDKKHYNCPKPMSALQLGVNPSNDWIHSWQTAKTKAEKIFRAVMTDK